MPLLPQVSICLFWRRMTEEEKSKNCVGRHSYPFPIMESYS
jgi:hypothetical protein